MSPGAGHMATDNHHQAFFLHEVGQFCDGVEIKSVSLVLKQTVGMELVGAKLQPHPSSCAGHFLVCPLTEMPTSAIDSQSIQNTCLLLHLFKCFLVLSRAPLNVHLTQTKHITWSNNILGKGCSKISPKQTSNESKQNCKIQPMHTPKIPVKRGQILHIFIHGGEMSQWWEHGRAFTLYSDSRKTFNLAHCTIFLGALVPCDLDITTATQTEDDW